MTKKNTNIEALLSGLPNDITIDHAASHPHTIELFVSWDEPKPEDRICPYCGTNYCVKKDSGSSQTVRHVPSASGGTLVTFHKPRYRCKTCNRSFFEKPYWVVSDMSITAHLFLLIYERLTSTVHSVTEIARETNTTPAIVENVMDHIELGPPPSLPETLGIDEFHGDSGYWNSKRNRYDTEKYHCNIVDADSGTIIDIRYKATFNDLHEYFTTNYPLYKRQKVKFFCTDMRPGFSKIARHCFPHAKICIDPFHVIKLLTDAISRLRIAEAQRLRFLAEKADDADRKALWDNYLLIRDSQRILTTSPFNRERYWSTNTTKRKERLQSIFSITPDLKEAYEALQAFYRVTDTEPFLLRRTALSDWLEDYTSSECPEIRRAAESIQRHRKGIENAWKYHKSNSPTEGLNKRIKDIKRLAFGAHDFEHFRKRALLACGYISFINESYTIASEKADTEGEVKKS